MHNTTATLLILSLILSPITAIGVRAADQDVDWQQRGMPISQHFDTQDISSNPQNFVISQDHKGFLYVANGSGILVFDGEQWQNISNADQVIYRDFAISNDGKIYAGATNDLGYFVADDLGNWQFISIIAELPMAQQTEARKYLDEIFQVSIFQEFILFSSMSHLFYYHPSQGLKWIEKALYPISMTEHNRQLLVTSSKGPLHRIEVRKNRLVVTESKQLAENINFLNIISLGPQQQLIYDRKKIFRIDNQLNLSAFETDIDDWFIDNKITEIIVDDQQQLIVGTIHGGIAILSKNGQLRQVIGKNNGLKHNNISNLFIDREQNLWASSSSNGVSRIEYNSPISIFPSTGPHHLSATTVQFKDRIFVGALDGLFVLNKAKNKFQQSAFEKIDAEISLALSLLPVDDQLLVAHSKGIIKLTIKSSGELLLEPLLSNVLAPNTAVKRLIRSKDKTNTVYAVTNQGIIRLIKSEKGWQATDNPISVGEAIYSMQQTTKNELWLGSRLGHFFKLSNLAQWPDVTVTALDHANASPPMFANTMALGDSSLFNNGVGGTVLTLQDDETKLAPSKIADWQQYDINSLMLLHQNRSNQAWFASWSANINSDRVGLLRPINQQQYVIDFSPMDQLKLSFTLGLYQDLEEFLWVNSKAKIIRFDNRKRFKVPALNAPVMAEITEIGSNKTLLFNNQIAQQQDSTVQLQASENALRIRFSSVDFKHIDTVEYRYKLAETNADWSDWQLQDEIEVTNLSDGQHRLELQYRTRPQNISPSRIIMIERLPFWYQSWWGISLLLLLGVLVTLLSSFIISRYHNRQLFERAKTLENQVAQRTVEITQKNEQLKHKNEKLQKVDEAKNRFFTNISHEFRTPLTLAIGPLKEVINSGKIHSKDDLSYINTALRNNLHMMNLLGQVLDINKLESDGMPVNLSEMYLVSSIQYCLQRFQFQLQKRQLEFTTKGFENEYQIHFDPEHFEKIVLNLLSNAIKFSPQGSTLKIVITCADNHLSFSVADRGQGIRKEDIPHIFDRYYQGQDSSQTLQPGTGIGLALVKELLDLHHASIEVKSEWGKGTQFTVVFSDDSLIKKCPIDSQQTASNALLASTEAPQLEPREDTKEVDSTTAILGSTNINPVKKRVLVVDDNDELRQFIRSTLQNTYQIIEADNGRIALQKAIDEHPDLIVSDVMMPVMDGYQLAEQLKSNQITAHIPLILLTAKSAKRDIVEGLQQGADDYISKPFDNSELSARIAAQLAQQQRIAKQIYRQFRENENRQEGAQHSPSEIVVNPTDHFSESLITLINEKLADEYFDVEQMANGLNTTRSTLFRKIKKRFDCTPKQLLKSKRLAIALKMLKNHKGTVSEIAYAVGFQSLSSFSRAFTQEFGKSPTQIDHHEE